MKGLLYQTQGTVVKGLYIDVVQTVWRFLAKYPDLPSN